VKAVLYQLSQAPNPIDEPQDYRTLAGSLKQDV